MAYSTVFCINLIDTIVNKYITVQEQWKILEITIAMCLHCHAHCNCNCFSHCNTLFFTLFFTTVIVFTSGSFQSRQRSGNRIINAVCFAVFVVLRNFSQNIFQRCYV